MTTSIRAMLNRSPLDVAAELLGSTLAHRTDDGTVAVALTEVEAYDGRADPASHAYRGQTPRNSVMFGPAGRLYVYFSYGVHWCCNVVTGLEGQASAVLLRSGRVVEGVELARRRRGARVPDRGLARGPACLARALGIDGSCNGVDLLVAGSPLRLEVGERLRPVAAGPRVGVSAAADARWRFWLQDDETVSSYRRSARAPAG